MTQVITPECGQGVFNGTNEAALLCKDIRQVIPIPPGTVTRFVVRWAPTDMTVRPSSSASLRYPFLPNDAMPNDMNATFGYVWHCHIVDHEDNEMMRPDAIVPRPHAPRSYVIGIDY